MVQRTDLPRDTAPRQLFADQADKNRLEVRNGLLQFDEVIRLVGVALGAGTFRLTADTIRSLHHFAIHDIYSCAGNYRTGPVSISNTSHQPPPHTVVHGQARDCHATWISLGRVHTAHAGQVQVPDSFAGTNCGQRHTNGPERACNDLPFLAYSMRVGGEDSAPQEASMMNFDLLQHDLRDSLAGGVEVGIGAIGLGMFTPDGRQVGAVVRETGLPDILEVSDGGETWSDLWTDGYVRGMPSTALRSKLESLCRSYGVQWDQKTTAITCVVKRGEFSTAARKIALASVAIDSWRMWITERESGLALNKAIIGEVTEAAAKREWEVEEDAPIRGDIAIEWRAAAVLRRKDRQVALTFLDERSREGAVQRAAGWLLGTKVPLIFVAPEHIANDIGTMSVFAGTRAKILPKVRSGLGLAIVDTAERIAVAA